MRYENALTTTASIIYLKWLSMRRPHSQFSHMNVVVVYSKMNKVKIHRERERATSTEEKKKSIHTAHKLFNYLNLQFYYTVGRSKLKLKLKWKRTEEKDGKSVAMILRTHTQKNTQFSNTCIDVCMKLVAKKLESTFFFGKILDKTAHMKKKSSNNKLNDSHRKRHTSKSLEMDDCCDTNTMIGIVLCEMFRCVDSV